jgi:mono/diheme cytochrome c family protein
MKTTFPVREFLRRHLGRCVVAALLVFSDRLAAQTLFQSFDPVCGLPRVTVRDGTADVTYELRGTDDLGAPGVWESLMRLKPGKQEHHLLDFSGNGHGHGRRFYQLHEVPPSPERPADNFALLDQNGVRHEFYREGDARAVVLLFTDNVNLAEAWRLVQVLEAKFAAQHVRLWMVNPRDTRSALVQAASAAKVTAPVLHDLAQILARTHLATTALEAVALDPITLGVIYRGAVMERCETPGGVVEQPYLETALTQFLSGQPVVVESAKPRGDSLQLAAIAPPSYSRDIAPLLQAKCVTCHRPGDIGSFAMTNHAIVAAHANPTRQNLLTGRMPPWHADPAYGSFANDFSLQPAEVAQLVAWLDAGSPRGDGPDPLTAAPVAPPVWPLGPPDLVLSIASQSLPASGEIDYRYLIVNNPLPTNVWLRAATVRPGNREVVHHSLVFAATTVADFLQVQGGLGGFFAGYVPGADPAEYPAGTGKQMKRGSYLIFQMHYTPNGTATTDRTQIGLYFAKTPPARELTTTAAYDKNFTILPFEKDHEVVAEAVVAKASFLYEMSPHMHFRGHRMRFEAIYPDGSKETLLNVPGYEFAWQALYRLTQPKAIPAGTRLRITGGFDNSEWNPWNPAPDATVLFGEQTSDEMLIGYLNLAPQ